MLNMLNAKSPHRGRRGLTTDDTGGSLGVLVCFILFINVNVLIYIYPPQKQNVIRKIHRASSSSLSSLRAPPLLLSLSRYSPPHGCMGDSVEMPPTFETT